MTRFLLKTTLFGLAVAFQLQCLSMLFQETKPVVVIGNQDATPTFAILVTDMDLELKIQKASPMPYTENAFGLVIVGRHFPFERARELIQLSRNYYKGIRYIAFYDRIKSHPSAREKMELEIGAPTELALEKNLTQWSEADFHRLATVRTYKEFVSLIESH